MPIEQWIRAAAVVVGDDSVPLSDHAVRIVDNRIMEVVPGGRAPADALHLENSTIAPGFVDAHVHLLFDYCHDHEITRAAVVGSTVPELALDAYGHALECLLGGITTVRDLGDRDGVTATVRDRIAGGMLGPRILTAGAPITITGGHLAWCGGAADGPQEIVRRTRQLCASGVDVIKVMASGGNMTRESNKTLPQFTVEELSLIVREAHRGRKRVAAHALNSAAIRRCIDAGVDTIEHCGWVDEAGRPDIRAEDLTRMREKGIVGTLTMAGIARELLPGAERSVYYEQAISTSPSGGDLYADYEWARQMRSAGVGLALASDAGVRFTPFQDFLGSLRCAVVGLRIGANAAITMATGTAADAVGLGDEIGTLRPGKRADLVVLGAVITDDSVDFGAVEQVWRDGSQVVAQGRLLW